MLARPGAAAKVLVLLLAGEPAVEHVLLVATPELAGMIVAGVARSAPIPPWLQPVAGAS